MNGSKILPCMLLSLIYCKFRDFKIWSIDNKLLNPRYDAFLIIGSIFQTTCIPHNAEWYGEVYGMVGIVDLPAPLGAKIIARTGTAHASLRCKGVPS